MTEPPWRDTDPRPAYRDMPGPAARPRAAPPGRGARARTGPRRRPAPGPVRPHWGELPARLGVSLVIVSAALGALVTVLGGAEPGLALGCFLVAGAAGAALAVRARSVYRILPVPALAYPVSAIMAGLIHDRGAVTSLTSLVINAAQWIASGFVAMTAATALIIVVAVVRLLFGWRGAPS